VEPDDLVYVAVDDLLIDELAADRLTIDDTTDPLLISLIEWRDSARQGEE
jgi:hypothetical protein